MLKVSHCHYVSHILSFWEPWSWQASSRAISWRTWCSWLSWRTLSSYCTRFLQTALVQARPMMSSMTWSKPWPCESAPSIFPPPRAPSSDTSSPNSRQPFLTAVSSSAPFCVPTYWRHFKHHRRHDQRGDCRESRFTPQANISTALQKRQPAELHSKGYVR